MSAPNCLRLVPDQIAGAEFIAARRVSMLADIMGLGKTAQVVHAADNMGALRITIICPKNLRVVWEREFNQWSYFGRRVQIVKTSADKLIGDGVVILAYGIAKNIKMAARLKKRGGDLLALDEAHRVKEPSTLQTKAILSKTGICHAFERCVFLTGTPMPNNAGELFTFCKTAGVWPGSRTAFVDAFCKTVETPFGSKIVGNANPEKLREIMAPVYLRRTHIEGLPALREDVWPVDGDLLAFERETDEATKQALKVAAETGDWQFMDTPYIATIRRQAGLAKASAAASVVTQELEAGEPAIVVFAIHRAVIEIIRSAVDAAGHSVAVINGETKDRDKQPAIDAFQAGTLRVLIIQLQSGGEGLTLTKASRVIVAEPAWTPKDNEQAIARCWRRGQTVDVRASLISLNQSIDDVVLQTLARKKRLIAEIV